MEVPAWFDAKGVPRVTESWEFAMNHKRTFCGGCWSWLWPAVLGSGFVLYILCVVVHKSFSVSEDFSLFALLSQNTWDSVIYKKQKYISLRRKQFMTQVRAGLVV